MGFPSGSTFLVIGGVIILFFAFGGIQGLKSLGTGISGKLSGAIPSLQEATASTGSEEEAIAKDQAGAQPEALSVTQSRINAGTLSSVVRLAEFEPSLQTEIAASIQKGEGEFLRGGTLLIDEPSEKLTATLSGFGTAQFSTGQVGVLTSEKIIEIGEKTLTTQQIADIEALNVRREESATGNLKLSGEEVVFQKALQEELSKSLLTSQFGGQTFVGGKLFANPDFCYTNKEGKLIC